MSPNIHRDHRPTWRAFAARRPRVDRDLAFVGGLLGAGAVAGYVLTAALGGASAGSPPPLGVGPTTAPALATSATPTGRTATPPLSGGSVTPPGTPARTPPASVTPTLGPNVPAPGIPTTRLSTAMTRDGQPLIEVRWTPVDGGRYELAISRLAEGTWQDVALERPAEPRVFVVVTADRPYRLRVRAVTDAGTSAWTESSGFALTVVDDRSSVAYGGVWATAAHPLYLGGVARYTRTAGAAESLGFVGRSIGLRGPVGPGRGEATIVIDGVRVETIDTNAGLFEARRMLFVRSWPQPAERRLEVVVAGTAGRPLVAIDAFYILETVAQ